MDKKLSNQSDQIDQVEAELAKKLDEFMKKGGLTPEEEAELYALAAFPFNETGADLVKKVNLGTSTSEEQVEVEKLYRSLDQNEFKKMLKRIEIVRKKIESL